jgi:hypothetical protein
VSEQESKDVCRSGCKTKSHSSYAECLKDGAIQIGNLRGDDD